MADKIPAGHVAGHRDSHLEGSPFDVVLEEEPAQTGKGEGKS